LECGFLSVFGFSVLALQKHVAQKKACGCRKSAFPDFIQFRLMFGQRMPILKARGKSIIEWDETWK
jgi:hypothetical protein